MELSESTCVLICAFSGVLLLPTIYCIIQTFMTMMCMANYVSYERYHDFKSKCLIVLFTFVGAIIVPWLIFKTGLLIAFLILNFLNGITLTIIFVIYGIGNTEIFLSDQSLPTIRHFLMSIYSTKFIHHCRNDNIEDARGIYGYNQLLIKYTGTSFLNIHHNNGESFRAACIRNYLDIAKFVVSCDDMTDHVPDIFPVVCSLGHIDMAKWLYDYYRFDIDLSDRDYLAFRNSVVNNNMEMARWLHELDPGFNMVDDEQNLFNTVCYSGFLDMAQWLYSIYPDAIDIYQDDASLFRGCANAKCVGIVKWFMELNKTKGVPGLNIHLDDVMVCMADAGELEFAQGIYDDHPGIDLNYDDHDMFVKCCTKGHLEFAKWLDGLCPLDDNIDNMNHCMRTMCVNGHFEFAKWFTSKYVITDLDTLNRCFVAMSYNHVGNFDMAVWLYGTFPGIDIRFHNDATFKNCCSVIQGNYMSYQSLDFHGIVYGQAESKHMEIANWLCELCPDYSIVTLVDPQGRKQLVSTVQTRIDKALHMLDDKRYDDAIGLLGIQSYVPDVDADVDGAGVTDAVNTDTICMTCRKVHKRTLKMNCGHYNCLRGILQFYQNNRNIQMTCFYCRKPIEFVGCLTV